MPNTETSPLRSTHTIVVSDLHLTEGELGQTGKSLWKRYKRPKFFIDKSFARFIEKMMFDCEGPIELVMNGDIFDFDSVMRLPTEPQFKISWLEKKRGLNSEEEKSAFKMTVILDDHPVFVQTLRRFVESGNSLVFVIGNHDIELHWPAVQKTILSALELDPDEEKRVRFCEWFYISENDTHIEHGNQYDDYCVAIHPIHPLIKKGRKALVRLPFGNVTSRYLVNGMGVINPHVEAAFLMSLKEYIVFFYRYSLRVQPGLPFSWMWSSVVALYVSLQDGFKPAMRDPLYTEQRVEEIARKSNSTPSVVRTLREIHVHSAVFNPLKIIRELWLDRLFMFVGLVLLSLQFFAIGNLFGHLNGLWWFACFVLLLPILFYYSRNIESEVMKAQEMALEHAPIIQKITGMNRVVFGHTHREVHTDREGVEVLNSGTWSPAFKDPECREAYYDKCFVWIDRQGQAKLCQWADPGYKIRNKGTTA